MSVPDVCSGTTPGAGSAPGSRVRYPFRPGRLAESGSLVIYVTARRPVRRVGHARHSLQSERSFLFSAECACASLVAHGALLLVALVFSAGGRRLPADEREARVFFLLPPDRMPGSTHQSDLIQWGRLGGDLFGRQGPPSRRWRRHIRRRRPRQPAVGQAQRGASGAPLRPRRAAGGRQRVQRARGGPDGRAVRRQRRAGLSPGAGPREGSPGDGRGDLVVERHRAGGHHRHRSRHQRSLAVYPVRAGGPGPEDALPACGPRQPARAAAGPAEVPLPDPTYPRASPTISWHSW